jgi:hypothetical protein
MTKEEFEKMAKGIETGYTDRNGTPIKVGDKITLYHKCTEWVGRDALQEYDQDYVVGCGAQGYAYTGKVIRQNHTVRFTFEHGLEMTSTGKYKFKHDTDEDGNLKTVVVNNNGKAPKLTFEDLL